MRRHDLSEVLAIEGQSFRSPWHRVFFEEELEKTYSYLYVARPVKQQRQRSVLGYICFWLVVDELHITNLAVHPAYRRRGIGRRLVLYALQQACEAGSRLAVVEVRRSNAGARLLYDRIGFEPVQERPRYYPEYRDAALVLELDLERRWRPSSQGL
ncbi:MAG: ribosomal protein S18-alanine N-acetyltransferase [Syntrophobacteria bacterium]